MSRPARWCAVVCLLACVLSGALSAQKWSELPTGPSPEPVRFRHFPDRLHAYVWRNWSLVPAGKLAEVIDAKPGEIRDLAHSMGLPEQKGIPQKYRYRFYITVVRRNWHLLPYDQLLKLLEMSAEDLAFHLREDDFLWIKLGRLKPDCEPLGYHEPDGEARSRAAEIKRVVRRHFGDRLEQEGEPRFAFLERLSEPVKSVEVSRRKGPSRFKLRFIYSYFAPYGDPLIDPELNPYPDGLLQRLAAQGVNGVWLPGLLRDLAPSQRFPEFGEGHKKRLANLRRLVERAERYGIKVYLYFNEPRSMPQEFAHKYPEATGVTERGRVAMCTSSPKVRKWLKAATEHVFDEVPGLGGLFTITASENLTHCASHGRYRDCPRCRGRSPAEIIAEVNSLIESGVHAASPDARVIAWDWGWAGHGHASDHIRKLPESVWLMSVSEWSLPIERGGVESRVGEYSLSAVGPGPRAKQHWEIAKENGLNTVAKVQLNNTWEMSAVPYLPVLDLVAEHCHNLAGAGVDGLMLSWTLGGYPSPNLEVASRLARVPTPETDQVLDDLARERYGEGADKARRAWAKFSRAFQEFPFHIGVLYRGPQNYGPSNLLFLEPTGYNATMIGFPYDDVKGWSGAYPPSVLGKQFRKVADGWAEGLTELEAAVEGAPDAREDAVRRALNVAQAAELHFRASANQTQFVLARNALGEAEGSNVQRRRELVARMRRLAESEINVAKGLFDCTRRDSRIGFEASNQYYYVPLDLVEKVVNCEWVLGELEQSQESEK